MIYIKIKIGNEKKIIKKCKKNAKKKKKKKQKEKKRKEKIPFDRNVIK